MRYSHRSITCNQEDAADSGASLVFCSLFASYSVAMLCSALRRFVQMFPLLPTLLMLVLFLYSIPTLANLLAAADVNIYVDYITAINVTTQSFEMRMVESKIDGQIATSNLVAAVYFFFGIFWTMEVIQGLSIMTIAGAITKWYWRKGGKITLNTFPTKSSLYRALRFHVGTACFGAAVVVLVQTIQWAYEYLRARFGHNKSKVIQMFMRCIGCIVHCCVAIVKQLSYSAYIITAMRGRPFCFSAARVW